MQISEFLLPCSDLGINFSATFLQRRSLFHFSFYALLTAITINENGGLKFLISALDNWVAEIITYRNRVLIIERTDEPIDTLKANFTDTEIDVSQGDAIIINDEIDDELLPPPEYKDHFYFCRRLLLLIRATCATIIHFFCCHHLPQLRAKLLLPSSTAASRDFLCCQRFQLLSSSSSATVIFYSCDFCYHRLSLLPSPNTASGDFLCCRRFQLLPSFSIRVTSATIISHCCRHLASLLVTFLLSTFPTAVIVFFCCQHLLFVRLLLPSSLTAVII
ncbi:hypothetical protein CEXT_197561 [Caerostris extrusa]|uniref:Uncharacterized protein n=1 Tax=Caerostris extrusa TaxID=172846 RepID=A0AAV4Y584_CAEEX|nr:hypothetical protein CEXT_197561 [Caerostris extrusa]